MTLDDIADRLTGKDIAGIIEECTLIFENAGITEAQTNALYLLCSLLNKNIAYLRAYGSSRLSERQLELLCSMIKRRANRHPIEYILGNTEFRELELYIDSRVMAPRQESELLVEIALETLGRMEMEDKIQNPLVLDIGTGSGNIAISLAVEHPSCKVIAVDADKDALEVCRINIGKYHLQDRVNALKWDIFAPMPPEIAKHRFHLVCSNPPYIPSSIIPNLMPEVSCFEPKIALDGGDDGLRIIRRTIYLLPRLLITGGHTIIEIGHDQSDRLYDEVKGCPWIGECRFENDYRGIKRFCIVKVDLNNG